MKNRDKDQKEAEDSANERNRSIEIKTHPYTHKYRNKH